MSSPEWPNGWSRPPHNMEAEPIRVPVLRDANGAIVALRAENYPVPSQQPRYIDNSPLVATKRVVTTTTYEVPRELVHIAPSMMADEQIGSIMPVNFQETGNNITEKSSKSFEVIRKVAKTRLGGYAIYAAVPLLALEVIYTAKSGQ